MSKTRAARLALTLVLAASLPGCAVGTYLKNRAYDVPDVIDLKYGAGLDTMGLGLKLELTEFLALGLGYGNSDEVHEWRGRREDIDDNRFLHALAMGRDGPSDRPANYFWCWNVFYYSPMRDQWRFGAEVLVPFVDFGIYVNVFEIIDLVAGLGTYDPSDDDGLPFGSPLEVFDQW